MMADAMVKTATPSIKSDLLTRVDSASLEIHFYGPGKTFGTLLSELTPSGPKSVFAT